MVEAQSILTVYVYGPRTTPGMIDEPWKVKPLPVQSPVMLVPSAPVRMTAKPSSSTGTS